ncbi:hypothetical protein JEY03_11990 [Pseudomonas aeruginosa]|uniref:hypothetical protein n=1 Tax=Pseudomonas aeruginosa TaxID=287 RepID=UPI00053E1EF1|nr:hypothetical protein [Pseudomonas aeruginosa]EKU4839008.1 hypothetical protein [Pseudomonas aeruginosa]EKX6189219.1 hypothetical protein [Pseudomonas aeruginosa]ELL1256574.1 hypothetical protein [Pseudomonas aeruginosa]ELM1689163.1 hypothetical protein [Pseudomonas aeruginosa]EMC2524062.1 hypothetical protein [Pseudomonas aeruginosa]
MKLHLWIAVTVIGLVFILYSGVLSHGDAQPVSIFSLLMGCIFVVAGLIGVKLEDKAYAASGVDGDDERKTSGEFWPELLNSMRELFLGPKK